MYKVVRMFFGIKKNSYPMMARNGVISKASLCSIFSALSLVYSNSSAELFNIEIAIAVSLVCFEYGKRVGAYIRSCKPLNLWAVRVTKANFLLTISLYNLEKMLWELKKWSPDGKSFHLKPNSLNVFFKEMYRDQSGEFVFGYWGLQGLILW